MRKPKHTPSPWILQEGGNYDGKRVFVLAGPRLTRLITFTFGPRSNWDKTDEANANLVIAAPDLLAACQRALTAIEETLEEQDGEFSLAKELREAIAKAFGEA